MIRVLVADDHAIVRDGITRLIRTQSDLQLIAEASDGREAVEQFRKHQPDVTLMDLQMPDMNGIDAINAIRREFPDARIVVLTMYAGDAQAKRALQARISAERVVAKRTTGHNPGCTWGAKTAEC